MTPTFLGAAKTVTGSCFRSPVYTHKASAELCTLMWPDSGHIQETEAEWRSRENLRADRAPIEPLYTATEAQEILYDINRQRDILGPKVDSIFRTPVVVDSPLAISATQAFRNHPECYDEEAKSYIMEGENLLDFPNLRFTTSTEESKALNLDDEPKIILSSSGMCDAGRIKHHLKHNLWRPESTVMFVGYQAQGCLPGRRKADRSLLTGANRKPHPMTAPADPCLRHAKPSQTHEAVGRAATTETDG